MTVARVVRLWDVGAPIRIRRASSGIFNETYIIDTTQGLFILQKLHVLISKPGPTKNYVAVTEYLKKRKGYKVQEVLKTRRGPYLVRDGTHAWRLLRAVPGKVHSHIESAAMARQAGAALGAVHRAFKGFHGTLAPTLPMFRYGAVYARLKKYGTRLLRSKDTRVRTAAAFLLTEWHPLFLPARLPMQLIHTDPKISNFVFDGRGRAIAMIDFDTVQRLNPLYDIGDGVRSLCGGAEDDPHNRFNEARYRAFIAGYARAARGVLSARERALIPRAVGLVMLGLAARFLNDYIDDSYFGWDSARYTSRKAHNLARAMGQIALYKNFVKKVGA